jgi:hypothetical protein
VGSDRVALRTRHFAGEDLRNALLDFHSPISCLIRLSFTFLLIDGHNRGIK